MRQVLVNLMGAQRLLREAWQSSRSVDPASATPGQCAKTVWLCDTEVALNVEVFAEGGPVFVNLHENEQTSVAAARAVLRTASGRLVRLCAKGRRHVVFWNGSRPHAFDPNRMFTDTGARQALSRYASLSDAALDALRQLRAEVLQLVRAPPGQAVVALHNNSGTDYNVRQYQPGGSCAADAAAVAVLVPQRPEDFFVVTDLRWFERLRQLGFNVVLQGPTVRDDGSLSVWFQQQGLSYINVEARHQRLAEQQQMLRAVLDGLPG
jgi:hypothetical protein